MRTISLIRHGKSTYGIRGRASCCRIDWTRFFNQLLAAELRKKGWAGRKKQTQNIGIARPIHLVKGKEKGFDKSDYF
jgi:hypothetical protein